MSKYKFTVTTILETDDLNLIENDIRQMRLQMSRLPGTFESIHLDVQPMSANGLLGKGQLLFEITSTAKRDTKTFLALEQI